MFKLWLADLVLLPHVQWCFRAEMINRGWQEPGISTSVTFCLSTVLWNQEAQSYVLGGHGVHTVSTAEIDQADGLFAVTFSNAIAFVTLCLAPACPTGQFGFVPAKPLAQVRDAPCRTLRTRKGVRIQSQPPPRYYSLPIPPPHPNTAYN